ncbi:Glutamate or tyrosine decarboxylase [Sulfitobacter brevis]|uniref:Glutamate or tyrosine decarboxylase n=1 Tax=Sulfitobacter brevis TaxID=74348 RepID=A0A1I2GE94_9RHOB|nr:aspartate aminotransferase family protein [Sulfitobacter brevis]SFF15409.1 Glutamate or tyrosine decarboxylase [Sulfitobacter brevis]
MDVLEIACRRAQAYRSSVADRQVRPERDYAQMRADFDAPFPETGCPDVEVIEALADLGEPGLMQITHPRFFGWVMGGSAPVGVAADWLASAWGQNAGMHHTSPTSAAVEEAASGWLLDILDLPRDAAVGFVSGGTMANFTALAAARGALLRRVGWDCEAQGLFGAPEVHVFVGDDIHTSVLSALRYLGFGVQRLIRVDTDMQGRMSADNLARRCDACDGAKLIIVQAGQINTGAFDPFTKIAQIAEQAGAWLHVDGAFGLWARADPKMRSLTEGIERADSWVVDGHKWLQVPFDSGYAIVREPAALQSAMAITASYLPAQDVNDRVPSYLVPELSRRARGLPTWAVLKSLGRNGIIEMVRLHCNLAHQLAEDLRAAPGIKVMNDVVLNQIILRFGDDEDCVATRRSMSRAVIALLVDEGLIFVGGSDWRGEWVMRISVICSATTAQDTKVAAQAILAAWACISESQSFNCAPPK